MLYNSASMDLEQVVKIMVEGWEKGLKIVRLHTGSVYIWCYKEQMDRLDKKVFPMRLFRVSSFTAACCQIKNLPFPV